MYTVETETSAAAADSPPVTRLRRNRVSAILVAALLVIVGLATAWNLEGWPGRVDDDEGTYVAQAWAIIYEHTITHYPYWYDHPPGGWIQIAAFAWVTDGFNRVTDAIFVGREFMWCVTLISCVLVYLLCRRLGLRQATSAVAVLLFGLSPIAQEYHRLVSLDNVETLWVLAALVAATSPRRGWGPAVRAGACAAIAIMSKETAIILLPVIAWVLWQYSGGPGGTTGTAVVGADAEAGADADAGIADGADGTGAGAWDAGAADAGAADGPAVRPGADLAAGPAVGPAGPAGASRGKAEGPAGQAAADGAGSPDLPVWMPDWSAFAHRHRGDLARFRARLAGGPAVWRSRPDGSGPRVRRSPAVTAISRPQSLAGFAVTLFVIVLLYPIYALQRGELNMLWSALEFQFLNRPGSGSLLDSSSYTYSLVHTWVTTDPWLLIGGSVAAVLMLASRRLRPFSVALLLQVVILLHGGYLPYFYVTAVIPFAAVLLAGTADTLWSKVGTAWLGARDSSGGVGRVVSNLGRAVVAVMAIVAVTVVGPHLWSTLRANSTANGDAPYLAAASWAEQHVAKHDTVVVDDYLWVDLRTHGLRPLWIWKVNAQSSLTWKNIQYIILQPQSPATLASMPALQAAYQHSVQVKDFGNGLTVRRVKDGRAKPKPVKHERVKHAPVKHERVKHGRVKHGKKPTG